MLLSGMQKTELQRSLLKWYVKHKRDLPWRRLKNPYATFVSEVMLQQTQIKTVIPYFHRWMETFPTLEKFAKADLGKVLKLWEGLGYYSRARNLHKAANLIIEKHNGEIPSDHEVLLTLPGIGRYTAGAIASIAFEKPVPIVDGNVARVLSRVFLIKKDVLKLETQKELYKIATAIVPEKNAGDFNQALMELGSLVCFPDLPNCHLCPLAKLCIAREKGVQDKLPIKSKPVKKKSMTLLAGIVRDNEKILVRRRPPSGIWGGLWEIPSVISSNGTNFSAKDRKNFEELCGIKVGETRKTLPKITHQLTHIDMTIYSHILEADMSFPRPPEDGSVLRLKSGNLGSPIKTQAALPQCCFAAFGDDNVKWVSKTELKKLSFPVPHQKI